MTITLGWWTLPLAVSLVPWAWACWPRPRSYGYGAIGDGLAGALRGCAAIIITLAAWLVWALFR